MRLYPHQETGADWLSVRDAAGCFDEQGLGKTATAICAATRAASPRVLVVAPTSVVHNWKREFATWAPWRKVQVVTHGRARLAEETVVVTHGLLLTAAIRQQLMATSWDTCIVDECQAFRTPSAQRTQRLYGDLTPHCGATWVLSGTPMPNDPSELWTMLHSLAPERLLLEGNKLMDYPTFRNRFCVLAPSDYRPDGRVVAAKNQAELRERCKGFAIRRLKRDHLDLPPRRTGEIVLTADKADSELLKFERSVPPELLAGPPEALLEWLREQDSFARWRRLCGLAKVPPCADVLDADLRAGMDKCVVFAWHTDVLEALRARLSKFRSITITGAVPAAKRTQLVEQFQTDPTVRLAFCNIQAGGVGITLTAAADVVFVEQSVSPGDNSQAMDRIDRIGQKRPILIRYASLAGSADEVVTTILARKSEMIREVLK